MNTSMLLGLFDGIKDWFLSILDNIPRIIYFFFAAFASGIDALQCLMRKLAGLDSYWVSGLESAGPSEGGTIVDGVQISGSASGGGTKFTQIFGRDPLSEFIYGILGIGDRASVYRALHTVFISLSIFALILLVLATMIAMIKSHYNEDYQTTNPWKYIYAAIKGILTYFIMPVMVVIGLNLSSFILNILDQITAGTDAEKVKAMYGNTVVTDKFEGTYLVKDDPTSKLCYTYYDFFGAYSPTTTSTMGGMLFKAAAFSANRVRTENITIGNAQSSQIFGSNDCNDFRNCKSDEERKNYIADQIDFAFMNNIKLKVSKSINEVKSWYPNVRYIRGTDFTGAINTMSSFSKYNLTAVWLHYDLWQFQFIVAFGGGVTMVGVMLSVILGLMSRLIKGAALFIIYPPLISLGPLDNFKAFKSWGTQFMQQVLMAYGAILGMNIIMLILPYVQTIQWFGPGKSEVQSTVKKGFSTMTAMAGGTARVAVGAARLTGGAIKAGGKAIAKRARAEGDRKALDIAEKAGNVNVKADKVNSLLEASKSTEGIKGLEGAEKAAATAALKVRSAGGSEDDVKKAIEKELSERDVSGKKVAAGSGHSMMDSLEQEQTRNRTEYERITGKKNVNYDSDSGKEEIAKVYKRAENVKEKMEKGELHYKKGSNGEYSKENRSIKDSAKDKISAISNGLWKGVKLTGKALDVTFDAKKAGKSMSDAFVKSMKEMGGAFGLDKVLGGIKDSLGPAMTMKGTSLDRKSEGDAMRREHHATDVANSQAEQNLQKETNALLKQLVSDTKEIKRATENSGGSTYKKP